jgi:hypothetical protein
MKNKSDDGYLVFISHSSDDRWIAKQMANCIERKGKRYGVRTFLDVKDIESGDRFPEEIRENIELCSEFIVLISSSSIDRDWVIGEIGSAWVLKKRIIPIIDKISPEEMPRILNQYKAIDLNDFDQYIEELVIRVKEER